MIFLATPPFNETIPQGVLIIIEGERFKKSENKYICIKLLNDKRFIYINVCI